MEATDRSRHVEWAPSVYYAETLVNCSIEHAWANLLDYRAWNPTFVGAEVAPVKGEPAAEGEVVLIKKVHEGKAMPEFYATTAKLVPYRHIVWYVHRKEDDVSRNFVDFGLSEVPSGVRFNIRYYAQSRLSGEALAAQRQLFESAMQDVAATFKKYCEAAAA